MTSQWLVVSALIASVLWSAQATQRPHIIFILADDLGWNDVSFHGSNQIPTPNIDYLAYNGIILNNYYVSPICTPTRAALLTGRHPIQTGMQHSVIFGNSPYGLPLNETILPQYLNKLGYTSRMVGKWHLGMFKWEYTPLYRGFQSHLGYYQGCEDYYEHTYEAILSQWGLDFRRDKELLRNYTGLYSTDVFRDEAVKIIDQHNATEPLFLYLPFQAVHSANADGKNLQAPAAYVKKFNYIQNENRRIYAGMVSALDDAVGAVLDALKKNGMYDNSIIAFSTDNGGPANGFDYNAANNFPLRGLKVTQWEGGVRGVGFLHSPLLQKSGYVSEQMMHVTDWVPTLYTAAGGDPKHLEDNLYGVDSWSMLSENGTSQRKEMLHNIDPTNPYQAGLRVGDYKLLTGDVGTEWAGWYPPYQLEGDDQVLNYVNYNHTFTESEGKARLRKELEEKYQSYWGADVWKRLNDLSKSEYRDNLSHLSSPRDNWNSAPGTPVKVECGEKPANASTNCQPQKSPCLFHIPSDPCEYNNIAVKYPNIVADLTLRLKQYEKMMIPPGNKPLDDRGNPRYHEGAWVPWQ